MTTKLKLYSTTATITKAIGLFHTSGQTLQMEAHKIALSVLAHVGKNHDIRLVAEMIKAMPEMGRSNALRDWFAAFGPIEFTTEGAISYVKDKPTEIAKASAEPFWKFSPEKAYVPVNVTAMLESIVKKLQADGKKTGADHSTVISALNAIVPTVAA